MAAGTSSHLIAELFSSPQFDFLEFKLSISCRHSPRALSFIPPSSQGLYNKTTSILQVSEHRACYMEQQTRLEPQGEGGFDYFESSFLLGSLGNGRSLRFTYSSNENRTVLRRDEHGVLVGRLGWR